jgi:L-rhamnose-H+ transport protein
MPQTAIGLTLLVLAGAMNGSFTLPMKFTRSWAWENTWLSWTFFALLLFPVLLAAATVQQLGDLYRHPEAISAAVTVAAFGAGWRLSQIFLGLAVEGIGMALALSVIMGLSAAIGALIPLLQHHRDEIFTRGGMVVLLGLAIVLAGVVVCGLAGRLREEASAHSSTHTSVATGLFFCLISGVGSAFVNLGLNAGKGLVDIARSQGTSAMWSNNAVWLPLMVAGAIPNALYCFHLMRKNRTGARFAASGTSHYWLLGAIMAFFWFGSTVMYGVAANQLGALGTILGWPIFMSLIVLVATAWGVATGEWRHAGPGPVRLLASGVALLVVAIIVLSFSNQLLQRP